MPPVKDIAGQTFQRLIVIGFAGRVGNTTMWKCRCTCGNEVTVRGNNLRSGNSKSCGCLNEEKKRAPHPWKVTHGMSKTPEYHCWAMMIGRCENPSCRSFKDYGGRGITVCKRWRRSFENFLADMGKRPSPQHSLDRENNNRGYSPNNCKWATRKDQQNNRRVNVKLTAFGKTMTIAQWAREVGIKANVIHIRATRYGWTAERALTTPVNR